MAKNGFPGIVGTVGLGIRGNRLQFVLPAFVPAASITLFPMKGKKRIDLRLGPLKAGMHRVALPELAPGVYSLWIALERYSGSAHLVRAGERTVLLKKKT